MFDSQGHHEGRSPVYQIYVLILILSRIFLEPAALDCHHIGICYEATIISPACPNERLFTWIKMSAAFAFGKHFPLFAPLLITHNQLFAPMANPFHHIDWCIIPAIPMMDFFFNHFQTPSYSVRAITSSWIGLPISTQYWVKPATRTIKLRYSLG